MERNFERGSGILCHITSLPSKFGFGDFNALKSFVSFLRHSRQKYIQILPIGPTAPIFDNSPYHSISAFAINPLFISIEDLVRDGYLEESALENYIVEESNKVDFEKVIKSKEHALRSAFEKFVPESSFEQFKEENAFFLEDYALFLALKKEFGNRSWQEWPQEFKNRSKDTILKAKEVLREEMMFFEFVQFIAYKQFLEAKSVLNDSGIKIIGDLPMYVDLDSPDVWTHRELFELDSNGYPLRVAGVPPDYFSANGQLWGNPLYRWDVERSLGFSWWIERIEHLLKFVDIIRIDHFRGFVAYYAIPYGMPNAKIGEWVPAPVDDFFDTLKEHFKSMPFIAEDLGLITDDVVTVIKHYKIPNMRVLMFAFDGTPSNLYLPHNYENPTVVYTGTHDHNTVKGWFKYEINERGKAYLQKYLGYEPVLEHIHRDLIRLAHSSIAFLSIIQIQDVLGLDERFRMNTPGTVGSNWRFKLRFDNLNDESALLFLKDVTEIYGR